MGLRLVVKNNPHGISKDRYDPTRDGASPSLLSKWKACRERARLSLLGWTPRKSSAPQMFGILVHAVLERVYGAIQSGKIGSVPTEAEVKKVCKLVEKKWQQQNPRADSETLEVMEHLMIILEAVMPAYFVFWNRDLLRMDWFHLEQFVGTPEANQVFGEYESHFRGKIDGAFKNTKTKSKGLWLFETKTKSRLGESGEGNLVDILPFEFQTGIYLGALREITGKPPAGVLLNIVRRPNLKPKKNESMKKFADRVVRDVQARPAHYFLRLRMEVEMKELERSRTENAGLMYDFLAWFHGKAPHYRNSDACEHKYGTCEFLKVCARGDYTGLYQRRPRRNELEVR